ncbi:MAG: glycosyltransferase family 4 protein [Desulfamplus sp.]|nr:glycosyltransferase family 4 protein [Desulfamplus sp.]
MKILVFTSLFPNHLNPDNAIFIKNRMFNVAALDDCQVRVVAPVPYCPPWKFLNQWYQYSQISKYEEMDGIHVYHPRYFLLPKVSMSLHGLLMFLGSVRTINQIRKEFDFDLLDVHYVYPDGFAGMLLGRMFKKTFVISARGSDIHTFPAFRTIKLMIQTTLKNADQIISVCSSLRDAMMRLGGKRIAVIPNGIDISKFDLIQRKKARKLLSVNTDKKMILSVGSLNLLKGHHIVIDAMQHIVKHQPDVHLYIAGKGEKRQYLEKLISEFDLEDHITLLGHIPNHELTKWYNAADISCLASSREGWANVIMESMACGTPVVATNVWGAPEIITSPDVGMLMDRNADSISDALLMALNRDWDRNKIRSHVAGRTWQSVAKEVRDVFENTVNRSKSLCL